MSHAKYSRETKKQAHDLYWKGRDCSNSGKPGNSGKKPGRYSLNEISRITGMERSYISRIARGLR